MENWIAGSSTKESETKASVSVPAKSSAYGALRLRPMLGWSCGETVPEAPVNEIFGKVCGGFAVPCRVKEKLSTVSDPETAPTACGVKVTVKLAVLPAVSFSGRAGVFRTYGGAGAALILLTVPSALPLFFTAMVATLVVPTPVFGNRIVSLFDSGLLVDPICTEKVSFGPTALPVRVTVSVTAVVVPVFT